MPKPFTPKVLTGNSLLQGDVVYLATDKKLTSNLKDALVFMDKASAEQQLGNLECHSTEVVGAYLADITLENGEPTPSHFREVFRTQGPSNYFHGKQAEQS